MDNPYTGVHQFKLPSGEKFKIVFDWDARAALEAKYSGNAIPVLGEMDKLLEAAVVGLQRFHPDMTEEKLKALNPPTMVIFAAVSKAMQYAYYGPGDQADVEDVIAEASGTKKKNRPFRKLWRWLSALASGRKSSGA